MKKEFLRKKTPWLLAAAALLLAGGAGAGQAMAYFTTYVTAAGGHPVTLGYETQIEEDVEDMTKHIVIANTGESACYVRVKVFGAASSRLPSARRAAGARGRTVTGIMRTFCLWGEDHDAAGGHRRYPGGI